MSEGLGSVAPVQRRLEARTLPFLVVLVAIGLADAVTASYLVLFAADELRLDPIEVGVATSVFTLSGILLGVVAGRWVDRLRTRRPLMLGLVLASAGFAGFTFVRGFVPLLVVCVLAGSINLGFPQIFALEHMSRSGESASATAFLRGGWSVAWALGPVLAGGVVLAFGYSFLFGGAAVLLVVAAIGVRWLPRPAGIAHRDAAEGARPRSAVALPLAAVLLFHAAMFIGSFVLPLLVTRELSASSGWVGVVFGACAAVEVLVSLGLASAAGRFPPEAGLLGAAAAFVLYFAGLWIAPDLPWVLGLQLLRGFAIAMMGILGIELLQRLLAPRIASATALFANALAAGSLVAGVTAGVLVQAVGLRSTVAVCGGIAGLAVLCLLLDIGLRRRPATPTGSPTATVTRAGE